MVMALGGCATPIASVSPIVEQQQTVATLVVDKPVTMSPYSIGIGDAVVYVGSDQGIFTGRGYYPGATAEHILPIYNNYPVEKTVILEVEIPSKSQDGYAIAPVIVKEWLDYPKTVVIPPNSKAEPLITLNMPKDARRFADKWEFRITVVATEQGKYETAVSQRWLVTMR